MNEIQAYAYEHPLTRAATADRGFFRQIDASFALGLTVNK